MRIWFSIGLLRALWIFIKDKPECGWKELGTPWYAWVILILIGPFSLLINKGG